MKDLYYLRVRGHEKAAVDVLPLKDLRKSPESARLSPVFPLDPSRPYVPPSSFDGFVHFYFQRKPAHTLALLQSQYDGVQSSIKTMVLDHVWYSIGLANIIVFEPEGANLSEVVKFLDGVDGFAAKERWEVSSGALKTSSPTFAPAPPAPDILLKADYSSLPSDIQDSIDECVFCLRSVVRHSWQYLRVER